MCELGLGTERTSYLGKALQSVQKLAANAVDGTSSKGKGSRSQAFLVGAASAETDAPPAQAGPYDKIKCYSWDCDCPLHDWKKTWAVSLLDDPDGRTYIPDGENLRLLQPHRQYGITIWKKTPWTDGADLSRVNTSVNLLRPKQIWESPLKTHYYVPESRPLNFRIACYMQIPQRMGLGPLGALPLMKDLCNRMASNNIPELQATEAWDHRPTEAEITKRNLQRLKDREVCDDIHGGLLQKPMPNRECEVSCNELQFEGSSTRMPI